MNSLQPYPNIPLITKFNANVALYDSLGQIENSYVSMTYDENYIYFLIDTFGTVVRYNIISEESFKLNRFNSNSNDTSLNSKPVLYNTDELIPLGLGNKELTANDFIIDNFIAIDSMALPQSKGDILSILKYKGALYGFNGYNAKKFIGDTVLYITDNNKLVQKSFDGKIDVTHLSSQTGIRDFFIDENYNYYVVHNNNQISKFSKDRILQYSFKVTPSSDSPFNGLLVMPDNEIDILKFDFVREYTSNGLSAYPIILGRIQNETTALSSGQLFLAKIDETLKKVTYVSMLDFTGTYYPFGDKRRVNYNLTNYEYLKNRYAQQNQISFRLTLQNVYNNKDKIKIEIPISTKYFLSESHHFAFRINGIESTISVFCDGNEINTVSIPKGKYIFQEIFDETISVGNTYFYNNISLSEYLGQPNYYFVNNARLKKFKLYNKALSNSEIDFHVYHGVDMDDLVVSLPCDQRNEIDGIERQFKLDTTGNKSNKINIIVKNSQITNSKIQDQVKEILLEKIKKVIPITTTINDIQFR